MQISRRASDFTVASYSSDHLIRVWLRVLVFLVCSSASEYNESIASSISTQHSHTSCAIISWVWCMWPVPVRIGSRRIYGGRFLIIPDSMSHNPILPNIPSSANPVTANFLQSKTMPLQDSDSANARPEVASSTTPAPSQFVNPEPSVCVSIFAFCFK